MHRTSHVWTMATVTAELDVSSIDATKNAFLLCFANGRIKEKAKKKIKFGAFQSTEKKDPVKRKHKIVVAETNKMTYKGQNFGITACRAESLCQYYLGVLNKTTGKMRLVEAPIINLQPCIPGEEEPSAAEIPANLNLSFREKNDILTKSFGSSKKKRAMESRLRNQVKGEALEMALGLAVDHAMSRVDAEKLTSPVKNAETSSLIPPYDKTASSPADVYKLQDIISQREMDALHPSAAVFMECSREQIKKWRTEEIYSSYVLEHVALLPLRQDARQHKATLLVYLQTLMKLFHLRAAELRTKDPLPFTLPDFVKKAILDKFTLKMGGDGKKVTRCMPARLKDKLLSYILVLCLIIDEFQVDLGPLQADMKIGQKRLITFVRALGCRYLASTKTDVGIKTTTQTARLEVPLTFPEKKIKTTKGRR